MTAMPIRQATMPDRDRVLALVELLAMAGPPDPDVFEATYTRLLASPTSLLLVAEEQGEVCGYLLAELNETFHADGRVVWGQEICVDTEHRSRAVGRALMHEMERWAREQGAHDIALASRRAGGFYLALGYDESAVFYKKSLR